MMFVLLAVKIFAFVNSLLYSAESYVAAGKLTKPAWCDHPRPRPSLLAADPRLGCSSSWSR